MGLHNNFPDGDNGAQGRFQRFNETNEIKGIKIDYVDYLDDKQDPATALSVGRRARAAGAGLRDRAEPVAVHAG